MRILVVDGQGGKIGRAVIEAVIKQFPSFEITAVGTNSIATSTMLKGGAIRAATGENALKVACRSAQVIIGPIGIVIADALFGEVTPDMAVAVGQSDAKRILIPINKCDNMVAGVRELTLSAALEDVISRLASLNQ